MYERSAIVLERYFENLLGYRREGNIRDNFNNYCDLVEKLEKYQINYEKELDATQEFEESLRKIRVIQASQKKLYEKSVKLEYNRNLLFNNIEAKVEDTKKCIEKVEADIEKNNAAMQEIKGNLIEALNVYNDKKFELSRFRRYKKMAENAYNDSYEVALTNYDSITEEDLEIAKSFSEFEGAEEIIAELEHNGKNEKIPFNEEVMENATKFSIEVAKKEVSGYLVLYDKMTKLLLDIEAGATKIELHKKYARNEKSKMDFIYSVKDYVTQFLDYERMTVIHGRKSHNRLMSEACENFAADTIQINNLFELLVREITNKATKKAYKELYNKTYLMGIQEKDEKFKKEKNRVNLNTATLINSNYWRIEGIKEIYTTFYKTVSEVLGKNVDEFDVLKSADEIFEENSSNVVDEPEKVENVNVSVENKQENVKEEAPKVEKVKVEKIKKVKSEKIPFEIGNSPKVKKIKIVEKSVKKDKKAYIEEDDEKLFVDSSDELNEDDNFEEADMKYFSSQMKDYIPEYDKIAENIANIEDDEEYYDDAEEDDDEYYDTANDIINDAIEDFQEGTDDEEFDIFGEKYRNIDFSEKINIKSKKNSKEISALKNDFDDVSYNFDGEEEETLFAQIKPIKKTKKIKNEIEDVQIVDSKPKTIVKKVKKISKTKKKLAESDIW